MMPGGWTIHESVTDTDREVLQAALGGIVGVKYDPLVVATQIVAGTNYLYVAQYTMSTNPPKIGLAKINVFVPLNAPPILEKIEIIL